MQEIIIDGFDFLNMDAMNYYSFTAAFKGNKTEKARELCYSGNYMGSRKMDGAWNMLIKDMNGNYFLRSRKPSVNGGFVNKAEWIPHICKELDDVPNGTVFIGEIYFPNNEGSRKITSVLNCLKDKCIDRQKNGEWLHYYIFDVIAYNGKSLISVDFEQRIRHYLNYELLDVLIDLDYVEVASYYEGPALWELFASTLADGGEGIVITRKDCKYLCGKRTAWMTLKLKKELSDTIDVFIDGDYKYPNRLYEGKFIETWRYWMNDKTGEKFDTCKFIEYTNGEPVIPIKETYYKNWAGSISVSVMKDGKPHHVGWISNIPNGIKEEIVTMPEKWAGKVVEIQAMQIQNISGEYTFRHGRIENWRNDKRPEDCLYEQFNS